MAYKASNIQRVMVQPISLVFRFLQNRTRVVIWINNCANKQFEGIIVGFDEYMNMVLEDAVEKNVRLNIKRKLGKILLKGDTIALIHSANQDEHSTVTTKKQ